MQAYLAPSSSLFLTSSLLAGDGFPVREDADPAKIEDIEDKIFLEVVKIK